MSTNAPNVGGGQYPLFWQPTANGQAFTINLQALGQDLTAPAGLTVQNQTDGVVYVSVTGAPLLLANAVGTGDVAVPARTTKSFACSGNQQPTAIYVGPTPGASALVEFIATNNALDPSSVVIGNNKVVGDTLYAAGYSGIPGISLVATVQKNLFFQLDVTQWSAIMFTFSAGTFPTRFWLLGTIPGYANFTAFSCQWDVPALATVSEILPNVAGSWSLYATCNSTNSAAQAAFWGTNLAPQCISPFADKILVSIRDNSTFAVPATATTMYGSGPLAPYAGPVNLAFEFASGAPGYGCVPVIRHTDYTGAAIGTTVLPVQNPASVQAPGQVIYLPRKMNQLGFYNASAVVNSVFGSIVTLT